MMKKIKKRVVIYTRVSTEEQASIEYNSLESQKDSCLHYIQSQEREGWETIKVYVDAGASGSNIKRPKLQELLYEAKLGKFDILVVYKIDRLTRNTKDFYHLIDLFDKHKISLVSATQHFDTSSATGRLMRNIMLDFAQFEREMTVERTVDKMVERARKGKWNGGSIPIGYDYDLHTKKLVPNPDEVKLVRMIFDYYLEFSSTSSVAKRLNHAGFRSKTRTSLENNTTGGKRFIKTSIQAILQNPLYTGVIKYRGTVYPAEHAAIIDQKVFDKVQRTLKRNAERKSSGKKNTYHFLLKKLIICGGCGSYMSPHVVHKGEERYRYYRCTSVMQQGKDACSIRSVPADQIEALVIDQIKNISGNENFLAKVVEETNRQTLENIIPLREEKQLLEKQLQATKQKTKNLISAISEGMVKIQAIQEELSAQEEAGNGYMVKIKEHEEIIKRESVRVIDGEQLKRNYQDFLAVFANMLPPEQEEFLHLLVKEIQWFGDKIKIGLWEIPPIDLMKTVDNSLSTRTLWLPAVFSFTNFISFTRRVVSRVNYSSGLRRTIALQTV
ncbi:MAG: recombinase family protein [Elusimicrobia bacterium]|nr:recombinase family protein [Elusimicrobiota bacterium]